MAIPWNGILAQVQAGYSSGGLYNGADVTSSGSASVSAQHVRTHSEESGGEVCDWVVWGHKD